MKTKLAALLSLLLAFGAAYAGDKTADAKKSEKAKAAAKKKNDKNAEKKNSAQKAETDIIDTADKYNIWKRPQKHSDKK